MKSLLTNWKHSFKHNYSKLSEQFNNTLKTAAKYYLFCLSKPFNLLSLSISQGFFVLTSFHIFPLGIFSMCSEWTPEAYASQAQYHFLLHCKAEHKHQSWKIKPVCKLMCQADNHQNWWCFLPLQPCILNSAMRCSTLTHVITIHFPMV